MIARLFYLAILKMGYLLFFSGGNEIRHFIALLRSYRGTPYTYLFSVFDNVDGIETFNRELEIHTLGSARLSEIRYHFYDDQFYQVLIMLNSGNDFEPLLDELTSAYGMPEKDSGIYIWENKTISIRLSPEGASISYLPILDKIKQK